MNTGSKYITLEVLTGPIREIDLKKKGQIEDDETKNTTIKEEDLERLKKQKKNKKHEHNNLELLEEVEKV